MQEIGLIINQYEALFPHFYYSTVITEIHKQFNAFGYNKHTQFNQLTVNMSSLSLYLHGSIIM